jgi:hypothetical protein
VTAKTRRALDAPTRAPHRKKPKAARPKIAPRPRTDGRRREVRGYDSWEGCRARMERDLCAANEIIETRRALNELSRAQRKLVELDERLADALDIVILAEDPITMTAQQFFIALASRYATNEQLARFLYGRVNDATLNRVHAAFHSLRGISDEEWACMDTRARPAGTHR